MRARPAPEVLVPGRGEASPPSPQGPEQAPPRGPAAPADPQSPGPHVTVVGRGEPPGQGECWPRWRTPKPAGPGKTPGTQVRRVEVASAPGEE